MKPIRPFELIEAQHRSPLSFFGLTLALSIPFWVAGALTRFQLLPGLPVSALARVCPLGAAAILLYHISGLPSVVALLKLRSTRDRLDLCSRRDPRMEAANRSALALALSARIPPKAYEIR